MRQDPPRNAVRSVSARALLSGLFFAPVPLAMAALFVASPALHAQNATTGAVTGVVADPSGAVIPNATVTLVDKATGAKQTTTANGEGRYTVNLLKPSTYDISASAPNMAAAHASVTVLVGQVPTANLTLNAGSEAQNVNVSAQAVQLTDTETPALVTTFNEQQVQNLPAPGGDITTVAYTVPGAVVNAGGSYGNFSVDGLPGTSNLYVLNGFDDTDPFLNLNNSGSSNLTLGQGEIAEASVVENGYSAQYGRSAGAIINWTTKSGANAFHGQANYYYNGDVLNANDWFRNYAGEGRERAISNEWAANVGGPIIKNKLFFFADYEGLNYVLPASGAAVFPSAQLQAYTLAHVPAASVPFYQQAFGLYTASPNYAIAQPVTTGSNPLQDSSGSLGCADLAGTATGTGGTFGVDTPCEVASEGSASNTNKEWLFTVRGDWNISDRQKLFARFKVDHGTQPTYTSFVSPTFNTISTQPAYEGQLNDTIAFTPHVTNQFVFAANWYTAFFGSSDQAAALAAFPTYFDFLAGAVNQGDYFGALGTPYYFPQGRNVTQYQFVDDLSWVKGSHTLRFGVNLRRDDISDYDAQENENGLYLFFALGDFANGQLTSAGSEYQQNFASQGTAYLALYNLGVYAQDEWQPTSRLRTTLGIRFDRNGNPACNNDCFSRYNGTFPTSSATLDTPYNQGIISGYHNAFNSLESVIAQGRFGFNYDVTGDGHTVLRGGVGLFSDLPPATFLDNLTQNFPGLSSITLQQGDIASPTSTSSAGYYAAQINSALKNGYTAGQSANQISAGLAANGLPFATPNLTIAPLNWRAPKYLEYNLQLQKQFSASDAVIIGYSGNHGYDEFIQNPFVDAYSPTGFGGLPTTQADPRFNAALGYENEASSNYNGLAVTYKHIDKHGLSVDVTYNYSHALDEVSNGGEGEYFNLSSVLGQLSPAGTANLNYGNADYDVRNNVTADYVYQMPYFHQYGKLVNSVAGGWLFSGKTFWRTGQPFSVVNSGLPVAAGGTSIATELGGSPQVLAAVAPGANPSRHCNGSGVTTPCFTVADFETSTTQTGFGNIPRNSFYGPHYADSDFALSKKFYDSERAQVQIGTYAFNVFNHPNFALPASDVGGGNVGSSGSIVAPPTSPYGSFQSAGVGGRVLQVFGKVTF